MGWGSLLYWWQWTPLLLFELDPGPWTLDVSRYFSQIMPRDEQKKPLPRLKTTQSSLWLSSSLGLASYLSVLPLWQFAIGTVSTIGLVNCCQSICQLCHIISIIHPDCLGCHHFVRLSLSCVTTQASRFPKQAHISVVFPETIYASPFAFAGCWIVCLFLFVATPCVYCVLWDVTNSQIGETADKCIALWRKLITVR